MARHYALVQYHFPQRFWINDTSLLHISRWNQVMVYLKKNHHFLTSLSSKRHFDIWVSVLLLFRNGNQSALRLWENNQKLMNLGFLCYLVLRTLSWKYLDLPRRGFQTFCPFNMGILSSISYWHDAISFAFLLRAFINSWSHWEPKYTLKLHILHLEKLDNYFQSSGNSHSWAKADSLGKLYRLKMNRRFKI